MKMFMTLVLVCATVVVVVGILYLPEKLAAPAAIRHSRGHFLLAIIIAVCLNHRTVRYIAGGGGNK